MDNPEVHPLFSQVAGSLIVYFRRNLYPAMVALLLARTTGGF